MLTVLIISRATYYCRKKYRKIRKSRKRYRKITYLNLNNNPSTESNEKNPPTRSHSC